MPTKTKTTKTATKTKKTKAGPKMALTQADFILLDRSGSMGGSMWIEALNSTNTYVEKLAEDKVDTVVTLIAFDSIEPFRVVRERVKPSEWKKVTDADVEPRGGTPLNDATAQLLDLAEMGDTASKQYDRVSIIIMTDGEENASKEYSIGTGGTAKIKQRLDKVKDKGWQVTFLGANFDNMAQAASYGATLSSSVNSTLSNMKGTMRSMASKRAVYGVTGQSISWSVDEQLAAKTDK